MPAIYEHAVAIGPEAIDRLGHVNNLVYLSWMIEAALAHSAVQGWPTERYEKLGQVWVVRSHQIKYLQPGFLQDGVIVRTWVAGMKRASSLREYKIVRAADRALLASAATEWAFVDLASGTLKRIPAELVDSFELTDGA
ncbi:MAG: acyl-CoA thioesterase [Pirellulales bacterium]